MKFVYGIMAHAGHVQLHALLDRLSADAEPGDRIVLHLDRRSSLWRNNRDAFANHSSGIVELVEHPAAVIWGHHSQVTAQVRMLDAALCAPFDYYHLISGVDWPIASRATMARDIAASPVIRPAYARIWGEADQQRMQHWWFDERKFRSVQFPRFAENVERAQTRLSWLASDWWNSAGLARSTYHGGPWVKGSSWYSLPYDIAEAVRTDAHRLLASGRLRFTQCCDEHVVPTILTRRFGDRIEADRRYIDWAAGGYHPKVLCREDAPAIATSGAWFARKFDINTDDFFLRPGAFANPVRISQ